MTFAASIALISAGIAMYVAAQSRQLSRAPGWSEQRFFSVAALSVSAWTVLNMPTTALLGGEQVVVTCSRLQLAVAALHTWAWLRYSALVTGEPGSRADRVLVPLLAAAGLAGAFTPWVIPGGVRTHVFAPFGFVYRTALGSGWYDLCYAIILGVLLLPLVRFVRAWRRGVWNASVQALALCVFFALAINDLLVSEGVYGAPYLVDLAFLVPIVAVGYVMTDRFVADAREHHELRGQLERQVRERTADLGRAQDALHKAEKLAALGQFAAGVAHEVNNPAAVVNANLDYLTESSSDALGPDALAALAESRTAMLRIAVIVRQLLDTGRLAASPETRSAVPLRKVADGAFSVAHARHGRRVRLTNEVPQDCFVLAGEGVLAQVVVNLVVNAVQAIPEHRSDGHVVVRAELAAERVRLVVEDNGPGMTPEILRRVFEPFFTTKPFGSGSGLGLAVSRGLVASLGGELHLESTPGIGTLAIVDLAATAAPEHAPEPVRAVERSATPLRLLVVDDEEPVRSALRRLLELRYRVELATGVDDALARVQIELFDVVLCDVMMPAGGGERFYRTVLGFAPELARRVIFLTGGAVTDAARQFLRTQPQPVLSKPLDVAELAELAERLRPPRPTPAPARQRVHDAR
jgi:signal transduction histidine kinase/ActR/RegA family two-component response regulator